MDEVISPYGSLQRAVEFSVELGMNMGLLSLTNKRIRIPFRFFSRNTKIPEVRERREVKKPSKKIVSFVRFPTLDICYAILFCRRRRRELRAASAGLAENRSQKCVLLRKEPVIVRSTRKPTKGIIKQLRRTNACTIRCSGKSNSARTICKSRYVRGWNKVILIANKYK